MEIKIGLIFNRNSYKLVCVYLYILENNFIGGNKRQRITCLHYFSSLRIRLALGLNRFRIMRREFILNKYKERLKCGYIDRRSSLKGEVQRQLIHLLTGTTLIFLIRTAGSLALTFLLLLLAFYMLMSAVIVMNKFPLSLSSFLCRWGRPSKRNIPFTGTIMLLCGIILSFILYSEEIVYASIAIVAFGDSIATAVGVLIGNHKLPYSKKKTVEGTVSGIIAASLASSFFVTPVQALVGSVGGMLLESVVDLQTIRELDSQTIITFFLNDNFLIPVFSGLLMFVIGVK